MRHILTAPAVVRGRSRLRRCTAPLSGGEKHLVRIAGDLWHAKRDVGLFEIVRRLDRRNFERVLEGFRLARGSFA